jgi:hypothetical protein
MQPIKTFFQSLGEKFIIFILELGNITILFLNWEISQFFLHHLLRDYFNIPGNIKN